MAAGPGLIKARRRLSDIYKMGVEIRFGGRYGLNGEMAPGDGTFREFVDEDGQPIALAEDEVAMWVQPPSPMHRDMALRNANAAKSRAALALRRDEDSEEHLAALEFIEQMSEDTLYDYVLIAENAERQQDAIREVLAEEEWSDITALQESLRIFDEEDRSEDDPEVQAVLERQEELQRQVSAREAELREAALEVLKLRGPEAARKKAMEQRGELVSSRAFMHEYERQMTYFAVRDTESHGVLFFESPAELTSQPDEVIAMIQAALNTFIADGNEAKNSPRAESGSASSAPPSKPATSESSTPEESNA